MSKKKDCNEKWERKPAANYKNSCTAANFKSGFSNFRCSLYLILLLVAYLLFRRVFMTSRMTLSIKYFVRQSVGQATKGKNVKNLEMPFLIHNSYNFKQLRYLWMLSSLFSVFFSFRLLNTVVDRFTRVFGRIKLSHFVSISFYMV